MKPLNTAVWASSLGAILLSAASTPALAQAAQTAITPQDINRATAPARDPDRAADLATGALSQCPFAASTIAITINAVELEGGSILPEKRIAKTFADVRGRETTLSALCVIRERLIQAYRQEGYPLTRVELIEQRIGADGRVRFRALEAGLAKVEVNDKPNDAPFSNVIDGYADNLRAGSAGKPLKWSQVERFALLMRDTPGVVARLELRAANGADAPATAPGTDAPLTTPASPALTPLDLVVTVEKPDRFGAFASIQRNSAPVFGQYSGALGGQVRGVMPWGGDELSAVVYSTVSGRQAVGQAAYSWRHASGVSLRGSAAYAETRPGRSFAPLDLKGRSTSFGLAASYPFILRSALQVEGGVGLDYVDQDNFIFEDESISSDQVRIANGQVEIRWRDVQARRARAAATVEVRQGLEAFDASRPGDPTLSRIDADPQALVVRVRANGEWRTRRNGPGVSLAADYQSAEDPLVSFEQYQVGNLTFGRGYDPGSVTGDRGRGGRIELLGGRLSAESGAPIFVEPYVFYDRAVVESLSASAIEPERDLASYGGGARWRYSDRLSLDIGFAQALDKPGLNQREPPRQFLMNLTVQY